MDRMKKMQPEAIMKAVFEKKSSQRVKLFQHDGRSLRVSPHKAWE